MELEECPESQYLGLMRQWRGEALPHSGFLERETNSQKHRGPCRSAYGTYSSPEPPGPGSPDRGVWAWGCRSIEAIGITYCVISAPCYRKPSISLMGNNCLRLGSDCFIYSEERRCVHPAITVTQQTLVELAPSERNLHHHPGSRLRRRQAGSPGRLRTSAGTAPGL